MRLTDNEFGGKVLSASQFFYFLMMNCFDDFIVLSWNVRGAANAISKRHYKELIKKYHPSIACCWKLMFNLGEWLASRIG